MNAWQWGLVVLAALVVLGIVWSLVRDRGRVDSAHRSADESLVGREDPEVYLNRGPNTGGNTHLP